MNRDTTNDLQRSVNICEKKTSGLSNHGHGKSTINHVQSLHLYTSLIYCSSNRYGRNLRNHRTRPSFPVGAKVPSPASTSPELNDVISTSSAASSIDVARIKGALACADATACAKVGMAPDGHLGEGGNADVFEVDVV